jgi:hypothetical protein
MESFLNFFKNAKGAGEERYGNQMRNILRYNYNKFSVTNCSECQCEPRFLYIFQRKLENAIKNIEFKIISVHITTEIYHKVHFFFWCWGTKPESHAYKGSILSLIYIRAQSCEFFR